MPSLSAIVSGIQLRGKPYRKIPLANMQIPLVEYLITLTKEAPHRMSKSDSLLIGAHCSAAGGVHNALLEAQSIGATTLQLFTANQRRWENKPLTEEGIARWLELKEETGMQQIMSHDSYLINLGAPKPDVYTKSVQAFREEIERCIALDLTFMNFHPGSHLDEEPEKSLDRIVESLLAVEPLLEGSSLRLLLEATAGQGSNLGHRFEELAYILHRVKDTVPIGVCIDTCHIFAAGYDIRDYAAWEATLAEFDEVVGIEHLCALHVNDSKKGLGSRRDRHAPLGEGEIGIDCFKAMMAHPALKEIPKYLETPGGPEQWVKEIALLRSFADQPSKVSK